MENYSSEQYKYLLLKHLQRHFSFTKESERDYTLAFYKELLNGIEITKTTYKNFITLISQYMKYCADNDITSLDDFDEVDAEVNEASLKDAFQKVGIVFSYTHDGNGKVDLYFLKPDGTTMTYRAVGGGWYADMNCFNVNALSGQEYSYAQQAMPYYQLKSLEVHPLEDIDCRKAGADCYWSYNADTTTMTINGTGTYCGVSQEEQIGSGAYTTLIIGGNIERLNSSEAKNIASLTTVVLLHASDFPLVIDDFSYGTQSTSSQTARTWDVYTDNEVFKSYAWSEKLTINWHTLDEWEG